MDSADIRTSGFYTEILVVAEDETTSVSTKLRTSSEFTADIIILSSGDQLTASMSGRDIVLHETHTSDYEGVFDIAGDSSEVTVALTRNNDTDAPNSRVLLPNFFEITAPDPSESFNAGDNITVVWTPGNPSNTVLINFSATCQMSVLNSLTDETELVRDFLNREFVVADSGTYTTSVNQILNAEGTQDGLVSNMSCPMEISLQRLNNGTLDSAFTKGGTIRATRKKSVLVNAIP